MTSTASGRSELARPGPRANDAAARILAVVRLAEEEPELDELAPYLDDPEPGVRAAAVDVLTELTPDGYAAPLLAALHDPAPQVSRVAATGLRELSDVIELDDELVALLRRPAPDPVAREVALTALRTVRRGTVGDYTAGLTDSVTGVRIEAVRGLVSLDAVRELAAAVADPAREVRVTIAQGLGAIGSPSGLGALELLTRDAEPLVRAAALAAAVGLGTPPSLAALAVAASTEPSWQVRTGAATGLGAAEPGDAIPALLAAVDDPHLDVRKAAVRSIARWADVGPVAAVLTAALDDSDADVRAYARKALTESAR